MEATEDRAAPAQPTDGKPKAAPAEKPEAKPAGKTADDSPKHDGDGKPAAEEPPKLPDPHHWRKRILIAAGMLVVVIGVALYYHTAIYRAFTTASTDDAYVNGHVTTIAPRVSGQVVRVLVDDNYRVKKGELLVELDKEPYRIAVEIKTAQVAAAEADLTAAKATARGQEATARGQRWKLQHAIEEVNNQVAALQATVAAYKSAIAVRDRAAADFRRVDFLRKTESVSAQELDLSRQQLKVAEQAVNEAKEKVHEARVALGLPAEPPGAKTPDDLTVVPSDLNQTFSSVRTALADLVMSTADLGLPLAGTNDTPSEYLKRFEALRANGDLDKYLNDLVNKVPGVLQADTKLKQARADLDQAKLNLRYCDVVAEIDGTVTRRNVNPGNNLQAGQAVMAVRSLTEIWIDANFKETQLAELAIGQKVDVYADVYGNKKVYRGHITGFTNGTGSTLALLPAENATGNFVKVVQRLPVRIEFENYNPDEFTLFAGLSVVPYVLVNEPAEGPNAGQKLQVPPGGGGK